jgi:hypothetical protein
MISVSKEQAFDWLWGITGINLALGGLLWVINSIALENGDFDYSSDATNALLWQAIGSGMWGFGVLVLIITLATSAIVDAITGGTARSTGNRTAAAKRSTSAKSAKKWLSE